MKDAPLYRPEETAEYFFREGCHILESLNDDADPAASIARARVAPGRTTRWHHLDGVTERYLIVSGEGRAEVGSSPPVTVLPGDVVLVPPGTRQRITCTGRDELIFYAICTPRFRPDCYVDDEPP